jgi:hypothetical protein
MVASMVPLISIIIPVGPRHVHLAPQAAASVQQSTVAHLCETIVINDGAAAVPDLPGCTVLPSTGERIGPAKTRNRGIAQAKGAFVVCLDADDYLIRRGLEHLLRRYARGDAGYTYGNAYTLERDGRYVLRMAPDYDQEELKKYNIHVVTALISRQDLVRVGGFDEGVDIWEDWTPFLRLGQIGICGVRIPAMPVLVYRVYEGDRMTQHYGGDAGLVEAVRARYRNPQTGVIEMASCCGGDPKLAALVGQAVAGLPTPDALQVANGMIRVEYLGDQRGTVTYEPPWNPGRDPKIKLGANAMHRTCNVTREEHEWLASLGLPLRIIPIADNPENPPTPLQPILQSSDVLTPDAAVQVVRPASVEHNISIYAPPECVVCGDRAISTAGQYPVCNKHLHAYREEGQKNLPESKRVVWQQIQQAAAKAQAVNE